MGQEQVHQPQPAADARAIFIDGYFTGRVKAGERPSYGYPANHLPETDGSTMELVTSFMAATVEG